MDTPIDFLPYFIVILVLLSSCSHDGSSLRWKFKYDKEDRLMEIVDPGGKTSVFEYEFADAEKQKISQLVKENEDGKITYGFDPFGRLAAMHDTLGTTNYEYDGLNRITSVKREGSPAIDFTYNTSDQITSYRLGDNFKVTYEHDFLGRIHKVKTPAGDITYEYWTGQSIIKRTLPNAISTFWQYRPDGKLESISHVDKENYIIAKYTYSYHPDGLISEILEWSSKGERNVKYAYDPVKRLVAYESSEGERMSYTYDKVGNRTSVEKNNTTPVTAAYDWAGRMTTYNESACEHDASRNLTSYDTSGTKSEFKYNASNLIEEAHGVQYAYDGDGNLIARSRNGQKTTYLPDPLSTIWKPLLTEQGDKKSFFIWEGDHPLAVIENGQAKFFLADHLGSVRGIADGQGQLIKQTSYSPYGSPPDHFSGSALQPAFTGLFYDPQTALYLTRARAYDPDLGRFLQMDPVHQVPDGTQKDLSLYAYCGGDPVNYLDLNGHQTTPSQDRFNWQTFFSDPVGEWTNYYGKKTNWGGKNRSGGLFSREKDLFGEFPLGDVHTPVITIKDNFYRRHDIQWFVDQHYKKNDLINVGTDANPEFFISQGHGFWGATKNNAKLMLDELLNRTDLKFIQPLLNYKGPSTLPKGYSKSDINKLNRQDPNAWTRKSSDNSVRTEWFRKGVSNIIKGIDDFITPNAYGDVIGNEESTGWGSNFPSTPMTPSNVGGVYLGGAGKTLEGLDNISGIAVDEAIGRLVLLSEDEEDISLPPLRLDDVVTIFSSVYLHGESPFVSIDPNPDDPKGDIMLTRHSQATKDTYVGWILFETDRVMKAYSLGKDNETGQPVVSNVSGYQEIFDSRFSCIEGEQIWERFWIVPAEVAQSLSSAGQLSLFALKLKVNTQKMKMKEGKLVPADNDQPTQCSLKFSEWFSKNYDAIAEEALYTPPTESGITEKIPIFKELKRIALITAIAENLRDQGVPFPFWMRDYEVEPFPTPPTTKAITVTDTSNTSIKTIYGGVNLSVPKKEVVIKKSDPLAKKIATEISVNLNTKPMLQPLSLSVEDEKQTKRMTAVSIPGSDTKALAPCNLSETDLVVPVKNGYFISMSRNFNSFFTPTGIFGDLWTMNLPLLEKQKIPTSKKEDVVEFSTKAFLITPLNSINQEVTDLYIGKNHHIGYETEMIIWPDDTKWHFNHKGNMVGREEGPFTTVYCRDKSEGKLERIEGWYKDKRLAYIDLEYAPSGKLQSVQGSNDDLVNYHYDENGYLGSVELTEGKLTYKYKDKKISEIHWNDHPVKHFYYNNQGQLIKEENASQTEVAYQTSASDEGYKFVATSGEKSQVIAYDPSFRPLSLQFPDNATVQWNYQADNSVNAQLETALGEKYTLTFSGNGKERSLELPEGAVFQSEWDEMGRLIHLKMNGEEVLEQNWHPNGLLQSLRKGNTVMQPEYNSYGEPTRIIIGSINSKENNFKEWVEEVYDEEGRVVQLRDNAGKDMNLRYNASGQLAAVLLNQGSMNISRNDEQAIDEITTSWGTYQRNTYEDGKLKKIEIGQNGYKDEIKFKEDQPYQLDQYDGGKWELDYDESTPYPLVKEIKAPNDLIASYEYDTENRLISVDLSGQHSIEYMRDDKGCLESITLKPSP